MAVNWSMSEVFSMRDGYDDPANYFKTGWSLGAAEEFGVLDPIL